MHRKGFFLAQWMERKGLSQADVARRAGWNRAKVSLILSGKQKAHVDDLIELADAIGIESYQLLIEPQNRPCNLGD